MCSTLSARRRVLASAVLYGQLACLNQSISFTLCFSARTFQFSYVADVLAGIDFLATKHTDTVPILVGHSMGGAVVQRALTKWQTRRRRPTGLVLLASAPLSGGGLDVAHNRQAVEAALPQQVIQDPSVISDMHQA